MCFMYLLFNSIPAKCIIMLSEDFQLNKYVTFIFVVDNSDY